MIENKLLNQNYLKKSNNCVFSKQYVVFCILFLNIIQKKERWLSGLRRLIANPLYDFFVPRVRIPLSPKVFRFHSLYVTRILNLQILFFNHVKKNENQLRRGVKQNFVLLPHATVGCWCLHPVTNGNFLRTPRLTLEGLNPLGE